MPMKTKVSRRPGPRADCAAGLVGAERGLRHGRSRGRAEWPDREARPAFKPAALAAPDRAEYPSTPLGLVQRTPNLLGALHAARTRSRLIAPDVLRLPGLSLR